MSEDIELLIKIQGRLNSRFHLYVDTNLKDKYRYLLFINFNDERDYFSKYNQPILATEYGDTVEDLKNYLEKHDGFNGRW